jgi:hypothetical protein
VIFVTNDYTFRRHAPQLPPDESRKSLILFYQPAAGRGRSRRRILTVPGQPGTIKGAAD